MASEGDVGGPRLHGNTYHALYWIARTGHFGDGDAKVSRGTRFNRKIKGKGCQCIAREKARKNTPRALNL
jgi:hypothetical protein